MDSGKLVGSPADSLGSPAERLGNPAAVVGNSPVGPALGGTKDSGGVLSSEMDQPTGLRLGSAPGSEALPGGAHSPLPAASVPAARLAGVGRWRLAGRLAGAQRTTSLQGVLPGS